MPKFSANISMLFGDRDLPDRVEAAANSGFSAVECQFPYDISAETLCRVLSASGMEMVLINLPAGDWEQGDRGLGCLPERSKEYRAGVDQAIEYAQALGCNKLNLLAGIRPPGISDELAEHTLLENIQYTAQKLSPYGIDLLIEAINQRDVPGFFLSHSHQAFDLIKRAGCSNLLFQFDLYHMQIMEGDLVRTVSENLTHIGHIQFADNPGRHQPGTGELNWPFIFQSLDDMGYGGWVGAEYLPTGATEQSLGWLTGCSR